MQCSVRRIIYFPSRRSTNAPCPENRRYGPSDCSGLQADQVAPERGVMPTSSAWTTVLSKTNRPPISQSATYKEGLVMTSATSPGPSRMPRPITPPTVTAITNLPVEPVSDFPLSLQCWCHYRLKVRSASWKRRRIAFLLPVLFGVPDGPAYQALGEGGFSAPRGCRIGKKGRCTFRRG